MSQQLAISSFFSVLAMALLCITTIGEHGTAASGPNLLDVRANLPDVVPTMPGLLPN
ncbi:MAG: hypothetical protein AAGK02_02915 [Pseudomonadota bacterium]